ncbi:retrovirus-related Pol polyprotein from transposon 17.6 [Trichonephila clavipes]|nr:retrovirus-related Pol polyprotein from transposon 17.6 [Trichonephila clavipes]
MACPTILGELRECIPRSLRNSDNGPQFLSEALEHLSNRFGMNHVQTVAYRPPSNRMERVNRDVLQMLASFVNDNHETWDQFLKEFAYALRTAVHETTGKTQAELFLDKKLLSHFKI